jgi:hypothetical protein
MFSTGAVPVKDFLGCKVTTAKANWYDLTDVSHQKALFKNFFSLLDENVPITSGWEL